MMSTETTQVPIIIKAPNQTFDDVRIKCNPKWTIHELKKFISQNYPTQPNPDGQKLIYYGKLLLDNSLVEEVLKSYNGQKNNTIHLVLTSQRDIQKGTKEILTSRDSSSSEPTNPTNSPKSLNSDTFYQERAYIMYAYMQYIMYHTQRRRKDSVSFTPIRRTETQTGYEDHLQNHQNNVNAEEERVPNRDWIDWVYIMSKISAIISFIYFYSSPFRCIMVSVMASVLFFWRPFQINNLLNNNLNNNNNNPPTDGRSDEEGTDGTNNRDEYFQFHERLGWIKTVLNFIISFLISLVPDNREI